MSTYPNFIQTVNSSDGAEDDIRVERSSNGTTRGRIMWASAKKVFTLEHVLTSDQVDTLEAFYVAERGQTFDFVWGRNNSTHTVFFQVPPQYTPLGGNLFTASVTLEAAA